jgi:hypothetical protein
MSPTIPEIAAAYIEYCRTQNPELDWASFAEADLWLEERWDDLWKLVESIALFGEEIDDETLATLAAGPVEDLLSKRGAEYIDRVEALARKNSRMAKLLTGVWQSSIEPEVWNRVVQFCRTVSNPIDGTYRY